MSVPSVALLADRTTALLRARRAPCSSAEMRAELADAFVIDRDGEEWPRFVNNHAWALVRLQAIGRIRKLATGIYEAVGPAQAPARVDVPKFLPIVEDLPLPPWARTMVSRATWKNGKRFAAEVFTEADLRELWRRCGGRCAISGVAFRNDVFGSGAARRPYAPSLDRIDATLPYTLQNCRLVLQVVNFALNAFGDEVFIDVASATAERKQAGRVP